MRKRNYSKIEKIAFASIFMILVLTIIFGCFFYMRASNAGIRDKGRVIELIDYVDQNYDGTLVLRECLIENEASFVCAYDGPGSITQIDQIRVLFQSFLKDNPDYFLNDNYLIRVALFGGPLVIACFSNEDEINGTLYDDLSSLTLTGTHNLSFYYFKDRFQDLRCLQLIGIPLDQEFSVLQDLPELEQVNLDDATYTEEDRQLLEELLPHCQIGWMVK